MDLGIAGKTAIVCASSRGLGKGCAMALAREGVRVIVNGTKPDSLEKTAAEIRAATQAEVIAVVGDVTTAEGRRALLDAAPEPDILVNNAGGPPPGDFREWTRDDWIKALDANMLSAIELIKATIDGMAARRFGRIVNITSVAVKAPISYLGLSNGARSGLTGFVAGLARDVARHNVTINNLLPGSFDTDRLRGNMHRTAERGGTSFEETLRAAPTGGEFRPLRHAGGVRRRLRVPVRRRLRLHHPPEHAARRRAPIPACCEPSPRRAPDTARSGSPAMRTTFTRPVPPATTDAHDFGTPRARDKSDSSAALAAPFSGAARTRAAHHGPPVRQAPQCPRWHRARRAASAAR